LPVGYPFRPEWEVTPRQAAGMLSGPESQRPVLLDCREPEEFAVARVEGSVLIPMGQVESRADELECMPGDRTAPVLVLCHHGSRSLRVTAMLRAIGFENARSVAGGIEAWSLGVDPRIPRY
jgi:rhodanese-related sulfurtransferase